MTTICLAFFHGPGRFDDWLVRIATRSRYSHVELVLDGPFRPGEAHDCISAAWRDGGVRRVTRALDPRHWDVVDVPWAPVDVLERIAPHLGARYDLAGIFLSQFLNLRRHHPERWFCSEICALALGFDQPFRYAPGDLRRALDERSRWLAEVTPPPAPEPRPAPPPQ